MVNLTPQGRRKKRSDHEPLAGEVPGEHPAEHGATQPCNICRFCRCFPIFKKKTEGVLLHQINRGQWVNVWAGRGRVLAFRERIELLFLCALLSIILRSNFSGLWTRQTLKSRIFEHWSKIVNDPKYQHRISTPSDVYGIWSCHC